MLLTDSMNTMLKTKAELTQELLKVSLAYNPFSGEFVWISKKYSKTVKRGSIAGSVGKTGYRHIKLYGTKYLEHHLAWFYVYGVWPTQIDHIDQDRSNNRIANLREVTVAENARNRGIPSNNVTGAQGVRWCNQKNKWKAEIRMDGKKVFQRVFDNFDEAVEAREAKLLELGFHPNHGKRK